MSTQFGFCLSISLESIDVICIYSIGQVGRIFPKRPEFNHRSIQK